MAADKATSTSAVAAVAALLLSTATAAAAVAINAFSVAIRLQITLISEILSADSLPLDAAITATAISAFIDSTVS